MGKPHCEREDEADRFVRRRRHSLQGGVWRMVLWRNLLLGKLLVAEFDDLPGASPASSTTLRPSSGGGRVIISKTQHM